MIAQTRISKFTTSIKKPNYLMRLFNIVLLIYLSQTLVSQDL